MIITPSSRVKTGTGLERVVGFTGSKKQQEQAVSLLRRAGRRMTPRRAKHTRGRKPIEE